MRRSDKIHSEAAFHPLSEYMTQVKVLGGGGGEGDIFMY